MSLFSLMDRKAVWRSNRRFVENCYPRRAALNCGARPQTPARIAEGFEIRRFPDEGEYFNERIWRLLEHDVHELRGKRSSILLKSDGHAGFITLKWMVIVPRSQSRVGRSRAIPRHAGRFRREVCPLRTLRPLAASSIGMLIDCSHIALPEVTSDQSNVDLMLNRRFHTL